MRRGAKRRAAARAFVAGRGKSSKGQECDVRLPGGGERRAASAAGVPAAARAGVGRQADVLAVLVEHAMDRPPAPHRARPGRRARPDLLPRERGGGPAQESAHVGARVLARAAPHAVADRAGAHAVMWPSSEYSGHGLNIVAMA